MDLTKLAPHASAGQNRTFEGLRQEAARIIEDAIETDAREDELYGETRGDELPEQLADSCTPKARVRELLEQARQEAAQAEVKRAERVARHKAVQAQQYPLPPLPSRHAKTRPGFGRQPHMGLVRPPVRRGGGLLHLS